jgi:hypothetical protein
VIVHDNRIVPTLWYCVKYTTPLVSWSHSGTSFRAEGLKLHARGVSVPLIHFEDPIEISQKRRAVLRGLSSVGINNRRQLVMSARLADQDGRNVFSAVLRHDAESGLQPLIFDGMAIPGYDSDKLEGNLVTLINHKESVAVSSRHANPNRVSAILFCRQGDDPLVVAATGQPAPGTNTDFSNSVDPDRKESMASVFSAVVLNARDQIAFMAPLPSKSGGHADSGLWVTRPGGRDAELIARTGDAINARPNDQRVIQRLSFAGPSSNEDGAASGMNDRGEVTFTVQFTDGSAAVVASDHLAAERPDIASTSAAANESIQEGLEHYTSWEKVADARLERLRAEYKQSDFYKLDELARQLKAEYQSVQTDLQQLLEDHGDLDEISYWTQVTVLRKQAMRLPMLWKALSDWQFQVPPERTAADDREFSLKTAQLLSKYGHHAQIRDQVAAKVQLIESATPPPLEFVPRAEQNAPRRPFGPFGRGVQILKQFAGSIGPTVPGLVSTSSLRVAPARVIDDGPLLGVREQLSRIVKLTFTTEGYLRFDYDHWTEESMGLTEIEIQEEAVRMLEERGISDEVLYSERELRRPRELRTRTRGYSDAIPVKLFDQIVATAARQSGGGGGGSGGGGNSSRYRRHFSMASMRGMMTGGDDYLELTLEELRDAERKLSVEVNKNGRLRIQIESDDSFAMLLQQPNGALRWITGAGADTQVHSATNFAEFYRADTEYVETDVIEFLNAHGIIGPVTRHEPEVMKLVVERLRAQSPDVETTAKEAIAALDADEFEVRQSAFRKLASNTTLYGPALVEASQNEQLSTEPRMRIKRLLQFKAERTKDTATVVDVLKIMDTPRYLRDMMSKVDEDSRRLLLARIEQLTE